MRAFLLCSIFTISCDRGHRDTPASAPPPAPSVAQPTPHACTLAPLATQVAKTSRTVAIGDLHGDLGGARAALRAAGVIDANDKWIGKDTTVIQLGDVLDRGDDESKILDLLDRLDKDAHESGGAVVQLIGNHELMNAAHDFRYVTRGGAADFGGDREHALAPGGAVAKHIATHNVIAIAGDTVLSHAGITPEWITRVDEVNQGSRCWLDGQSGGANEPPIALASDDSPVWTRVWGMGTPDCAALDGVLGKLGVKRMVVAHTVQEHGITSACDGKLWRIDVGLAKLYNGPIEVLELGDPPKVLRGERL